MDGDGTNLMKDPSRRVCAKRDGSSDMGMADKRQDTGVSSRQEHEELLKPMYTRYFYKPKTDFRQKPQIKAESEVATLAERITQPFSRHFLSKPSSCLAPTQMVMPDPSCLGIQADSCTRNLRVLGLGALNGAFPRNSWETVFRMAPHFHDGIIPQNPT